MTSVNRVQQGPRHSRNRIARSSPGGHPDARHHHLLLPGRARAHPVGAPDSVKSLRDAYTGTLSPEQFDFTHYSYVFQKMPNVLANFSNSIIVTMSTVVVTTVIAILGGYALAHLRLPGAAIVGVFCSPPSSPRHAWSQSSVSSARRGLGLINTLPGVILPYVSLSLAFSIIIMRGIFLQVSPEMVDPARVDGASSWRTLIQIMLPLAANGIVVVAIVNFVAAWGEFLYAYTLLSDRFMFTFPVVLATTFGGFGEWAFHAWPRCISWRSSRASWPLLSSSAGI